MAWEGNDYAETLDEAADILLPLTRLAALLRAPLPDSLSHLGKPSPIGPSWPQPSS